MCIWKSSIYFGKGSASVFPNYIKKNQPKCTMTFPFEFKNVKYITEEKYICIISNLWQCIRFFVQNELKVYNERDNLPVTVRPVYVIIWWSFPSMTLLLDRIKINEKDSFIRVHTTVKVWNLHNQITFSFPIQNERLWDLSLQMDFFFNLFHRKMCAYWVTNSLTFTDFRLTLFTQIFIQ